MQTDDEREDGETLDPHTSDPQDGGEVDEGEEDAEHKEAAAPADVGRRRPSKTYIPMSEQGISPDAPARQNILDLRKRWWPEGQYLLKDYMAEFGLTQQELAHRIGQAAIGVHKYSRPNKLLSTQWLLYLCEITQMPLAAIVSKQWKPSPGSTAEVYVGSAILGMLLAAVEHKPQRELTFGPNEVRRVTLRAPANATPQLEIELADGSFTVPVGR